ncbi:hypothetical protein HDV02_003372 [Globomyces sp. JEL0801]|nr:hypothetical protein HDV02_003372 [Globomyces sp. JEL0801]
MCLNNTDYLQSVASNWFSPSILSHVKTKTTPLWMDVLDTHEQNNHHNQPGCINSSSFPVNDGPWNWPSQGNIVQPTFDDVSILVLVAVIGFLTLEISVFVAYRKFFAKSHSSVPKESKSKLDLESSTNDYVLVISKQLKGSGGRGKVYGAKLGNRCMVAKIPKSDGDELLKERQIMQSLASPWTVRQYSAYSNIVISGLDSPTCTALIMEYMNLGSLSEYLTPERSDELKSKVLSETLPIITMVAQGLDFIHLKGYAHLDIKPENILLHQDSGHPVIAKISDFGSALPNWSSDTTPQTFGYIPPEQTETKSIKATTHDIYAFGLCLVMIKTHFNYSPMWRTVGKKVAEKRIFLENIITNTVLLDLTVACLQDEPSLRPNASQIISKLLELDQSDFEVYRGSDRSNSRLMDREETNIPLPNISSHTNIFSHTPGHYLFSELRLSNPSKWSDFIKAFMKRYVKPTV